MVWAISILAVASLSPRRCCFVCNVTKDGVHNNTVGRTLYKRFPSADKAFCMTQRCQHVINSDENLCVKSNLKKTKVIWDDGQTAHQIHASGGAEVLILRILQFYSEFMHISEKYF